MLQFVPSQKRPLAKFIAIACLGLSASAQASLVSSVYTETTAQAGNNAAYTENSGVQTGFASSTASQWIEPDQAYSRAFGYNDVNGNTAYAATATGMGTFSSTGSFLKTLTITNDTSYAQTYTLSYYMYAGSLNIGGYYGYVAGDTGSASLSFQIYENLQNPLLQRSAALNLAADGSISLQNNGFNALDGGNSLYTNSESGSLSLGILAAGATKTIYYSLIAQAIGNYSYMEDPDWCWECGYGYGGGSYAFLGDPDDVEGWGYQYGYNWGTPHPMTVTGQAYNNVPLPGTLALVGLGLLSLGINRRRRPVQTAQ